GEQEIEQIALACTRWQAPPLGDDLVDGCEPRPLKRTALRSREGERVLSACQRVQDVGPPRAGGIASDHYANHCTLLAVRHREQRPQNCFQRCILKCRRKVGDRRPLKTCYEVVGRRAEMREQGTDVVRREDRGQHAALLTPPVALGEEKSIADQRPCHPW